jgi:hypothetical protein
VGAVKSQVFCAMISALDRLRIETAPAGEDRPHRPNSGGPADNQYSPEAPVDNPHGVVPNTTSKEMPNTGGLPYLAMGAVLLLGVAVVVGRGALRR